MSHDLERLQPERALAQAFVAFCDGVQAAGMTDYAQRGRDIADRLVRALDDVAAEQSARIALQERIATLEAIVQRLHGEREQQAACLEFGQDS